MQGGIKREKIEDDGKFLKKFCSQMDFPPKFPCHNFHFEKANGSWDDTFCRHPPPRHFFNLHTQV